MKAKLTKNEKLILSELVMDGGVTNVEIAKKVNLTTAAIGKIRKKLWRNGVVKGYSAEVDLQKAGLAAFAIVFIKFKDEGWDFQNGLSITDIMVETPNIIGMFRIPESDTSHILMYAFRNLKEMDRYFHVLQSSFSKFIEIKRMYSFSYESILKDSARDLLIKTIKELDEERMPEPVPILPSMRKAKAAVRR